MFLFKEPEISDKEQIKNCLFASGFDNAEYSFGNIYGWAKSVSTQIAFCDDFVILRSAFEKSPKMLYPAGKGDIRNVLSQIFAFQKENGEPTRLSFIPQKAADELVRLYGDQVTVTPVNAYYDYIYSVQELMELKGKKYHAKRNHLNQFIKNEYVFEPITPENIEDCKEMNEEWCRRNDCKDSRDKSRENCAVRRMLGNFFDLELKGGAIRMDGKVVAFTMGEPLNQDTYVVHVEKAFTEIRGLYQAINNEFVKAFCGNYIYINREDDAGDEGLRKAKLSYNPIKMGEKFTAEFHF